MKRQVVAQAAGMVSVQANCTPDQGLLLMTERAEKCGSNLEEIAKAVIVRSIRFD